MSQLSSYPTRDFSETQKFLVLNPETQSLSLVLGRDLVEYITPQSTYVFAEQSRAVAQNEDYQLGALIQTAGDLTAGDNFAGTFLVVPGGDGDFPMANGNDLLIIKGDVLLREQLASNSPGEGSDLVAYTGTGETVTDALNQRTIYVGSVAELEALSLPSGYSVTLTLEGKGGTGTIRSGTPPSDPLKGIYIPIANGNYWHRDNAAESADLRWFDAVLDNVADDTDALEAALALRDVIRPFNGVCRFTRTISLRLNSTFNGIKNKSPFPGYKTQYRFAPAVAAASSTLDGDVTFDATTINLVDASGFPSSGLAQIGPITDCEYVEYTGKSGNSLTGCKRGWFGGTQGPAIVTPGSDNQGVAQSTGTEVTQVQNAFEMLEAGGVYAGHFNNVVLWHDDLVTSPYSVGRGNAIYTTQSGYNQIINETAIRGFERGLYVGRAYVTVLNQPMAYFCTVAGQLDVANGAQIVGGDSGRLGDGAASIDGYGYYFKGGEGATVSGGNHGNGGTNTPFVADKHTNLVINGGYIEAAKRDNLLAKNGGSITYNGGYIKEGYFIGRVKTGGKINAYNVVTRDLVYLSGATILDDDGTGFGSVKKHFDFNDDAYRPDLIINQGVTQSLASPLTSLTAWAKPPQVHLKTLTSGDTIGILTVTNTANSSKGLDKGGALQIKYMARSDWNSGISTETGTILVSFVHRSTLATVATVTKGADTAKSDSSGGTLSLTASASAVTGDNVTDSFNIQVSATTNAGQNTNLVFWYEEIPSDKVQFTVTEL